MPKDPILPCWCGCRERTDFAPGYSECRACHTLLSERRGERRYDKVENEEEDFYGKSYWFGHQTEELGLPDLQSRAKTDFVDRYPHWLRLIYELGLKTGKTLELGCGHGGFVYLLRQTGFDAAGLELSPWLADHARRQYQIPMMVGQLSDQKIASQTYDLVLAFDVLEHLEDPLGTLQSCREVLKPGGHLLLQTPVRPESISHQGLLEQGHPFLKMLLPDEHLFLFTASSLRELLQLAGFAGITERCSVFPQHDITVSASTEALGARPSDTVEASPIASALIALYAANRDLMKRLAARERDANERLELLNQQGAAMVRLERDANERLELLNQQGAAMVCLERDANERLRLLQDADIALQAQNARCLALEQLLALTRDQAGMDNNPTGSDPASAAAQR